MYKSSATPDSLFRPKFATDGIPGCPDAWLEKKSWPGRQRSQVNRHRVHRLDEIFRV
jgi:hypothetical protein